MNSEPEARVGPYFIGAFIVILTFFIPVAHSFRWMEMALKALCTFVLMNVGFANWARKKGHSVNYGWWALFPPGGFVVLPLLKDRYPEETEEPEAVKQCPHCGAPYRDSDYGLYAVVMICSRCRGVLPLQGEEK
jgi:hypothetical protein